MSTWKKLRMARIMHPISENTIIVPMDHHGTSVAPLVGKEDPKKLCQQLIDGRADCILAHTGTLQQGVGQCTHTRSIGTMLHYSITTALSPKANQKVLAYTIEHALRLGVDGISMHVNLWDEHENEMIEHLGILGDLCHQWSIPLLAMMYIRGHDVDANDPALIRHGARIAAELWADIVKVPYTGNKETMKEVVTGTYIPVVAAGGSSLSEDETLAMIQDIMDAWCKWLSMGRNIRWKHNPQEFLKKVRAIVHEK